MGTFNGFKNLINNLTYKKVQHSGKSVTTFHSSVCVGSLKVRVIFVKAL